MYKPLYDDKHRIMSVSEEEGQPKKKKPLGRGIREKLLCSECEEEKINKWYENPNVELWRGLAEEVGVSGVSVSRFELSDGSRAVQIRGFDYASFKLLLLSVLWRASVASLDDYAEVALGHVHEERIRRMLLERNAGSQADYPCLIYVFTEPNFGLMGRPTRTRLEGRISYQFLLPSVLLWFIIVDKTQTHSLAQFAPKEDGSMIIPLMRPEQVPLVRQAARSVQKLAATESAVVRFKR
jgi:hypothetical protein